MPLFEYKCRTCGYEFEALVRAGLLPICPSCEGQELERMLSLFAVSSESTRGQALKDGRQRSASVRREKDQAQLEYEREHTH